MLENCKFKKGFVKMENQEIVFVKQRELNSNKINELLNNKKPVKYYKYEHLMDLVENINMDSNPGGVYINHNVLAVAKNNKAKHFEYQGLDNPMLFDAIQEAVIFYLSCTYC